MRPIRERERKSRRRFWKRPFCPTLRYLFVPLCIDLIFFSLLEPSTLINPSHASQNPFQNPKITTKRSNSKHSRVSESNSQRTVLTTITSKTEPTQKLVFSDEHKATIFAKLRTKRKKGRRERGRRKREKRQTGSS